MDRATRTFLTGILAVLLVAPVPARTAAADRPAPQAYQEHCQNCHGPLARSNEPFYPSLIDRARNRSPVEVITAVMNGRLSKASSFPSHATPVMPALDYLPNEDIAGIVNYLYAQAGMPDTSVTVEQVAAIRGADNDTEPEVVMTQADYERTEALYFDLCAGCHGIDRLGLSGQALDPVTLRERNTRDLMALIHYGTPWGMPNWGTMEQLDAKELSLLARYLKLPGRKAPAFTLAQARASWHVAVAPKDRPRRRQFAVAAKDLFVSLLHDSGQVALIDGVTHQLVKTIDTGLAPHDIAVSANGRYLYVVTRTGFVALVDLFLKEPAVVARARIGYESRSLAVSQNRRRTLVAAGGYTEPQVFLLDGLTLEPTGIVPLNVNAPWRAEDAILQIAPVGNQRRFLIVTSSESGLFDVSAARRTNGLDVDLQQTGAKAPLGRGSFTLAADHFMVPTDAGEVWAYNLRSQAIETRVPVPGLARGTTSAAYLDKEHGPVWATTGVGSRTMAVIGTDPKQRPESAWRVVRELALPGSGVLHSATHPAAAHLWLDMPLSGIGGLSGAAVALDRHGAGQAEVMALREMVAPDEPHMRVIHPQINKDGTEVWYTLWNRQDLESALVVIDEESREVAQVISGLELTTPIRTFSLSALLNGHR